MLHIDRRSLLLGLAGAGAGSLLLPATGFGQSAKPASITVTSFPGMWEEVVRKVFAADFTRRTGVKAEVLLGAPAQWISQVEASPQKPPIDIIVSSIDLALIAGRQGLIDKISVDKVPNLADIPERFTQVCESYGTCFDYGAAGIVYHKRLKNPPRSMKEFVEGTVAGKWRATIPGVGYQATKEILIWNLADVFGGSVDNVDPAFKAIASMKKNCSFFNNVNQVFEHLETGEADVGIMFDGRVWTEIENGAKSLDFINPAEGGIVSPIVIQKVKNSPDIAWEYVNAVLDAANQSRFADTMFYGVTNKNVRYSEKMAKRVTQWTETRWPPFEAIGPKISGWLERWNKELG